MRWFLGTAPATHRSIVIYTYILRNGERESNGMTQTGGENAAPGHAALHEAALRHLARYATTRARLLAILHRRIERWAAAAEAAGEDVAGARAAAREAAAAVVARLVEAGAVDDAAFAAQRARRLMQAGRSRRAVAAHLAARGVAKEVSAAALPSGDAASGGELAAAVATARRRRIGPFRVGDADDARRLKESAMLARAGFSREVARLALGMEREAAERLVAEVRRR
jgi:regulatory protein